jgi:hypothetical protein
MVKIISKTLDLSTLELTEEDKVQDVDILALERPLQVGASQILALCSDNYIRVYNSSGVGLRNQYITMQVLDCHLNNDNHFAYLIPNYLNITRISDGYMITLIDCAGCRYVRVGSQYIVVAGQDGSGFYLKWFNLIGELLYTARDTRFNDNFSRHYINPTGSVALVGWGSGNTQELRIGLFSLGALINYFSAGVANYTGTPNISADEALTNILYGSAGWPNSTGSVYHIQLGQNPICTEIEKRTFAGSIPKVYVSLAGGLGCYTMGSDHKVLDLATNQIIRSFTNIQMDYASCIDDKEEFFILNYKNKLEFYKISNWSLVASNTGLKIHYNLQVVRG